MTDYCTTVEVMEMLADTEWTGKYEPLLEALITRASRLIDRLTGREAGAYLAGAAEPRTFEGSGGRALWVDEMAAAPTLVEVDERGDLSYMAWAASDYQLWPSVAPARGWPYTRLDIDLWNGSKALWPARPQGVRVTARWGYSLAVPEDVKQAVIIQVVRLFKRAQQAFQDTGAIMELGQLRYVKALDQDVALIVEHYRRVAI